MSVQFGRWNFDSQAPSPDFLEKVSATLAPYGPDGKEAYFKGGVHILYHAFNTTKESRYELQPYVCESGAIVTWDGRLDNRAELIDELRDSLNARSTDVAVVAATYEKWGETCLPKLLGDWAISIWDPKHRSLLLARDAMGTRHLYYSFDHKQATWSTVLDPLVLFAGRTFTICEEYVAGWLGTMFPAANLTPYDGIRVVPPSSFVLLQPGKHTVSKYWDFDPAKKIRYRSDAEYDEHFRAVFAKAVQRRLRSDGPALAELSGGLDSSSIVCMADTVIARGDADCSRLDTLSWYDDSYDDSQPDFNEHPYIMKVEEKRGRTGHHINLKALSHRGASSQSSPRPTFENHRFAATPIPSYRHTEFFKEYALHTTSQGYRVVLSGLAGESATGGGVPTPTSELQNLLARGRFFRLARQVKAWAAKMRKSRLPLLWEAARGFLPLVSLGLTRELRPAYWLNPGFIQRNHTALRGYPSRIKLFGPLPSFQNHLDAIEGERRLMAYLVLQSEVLCERRYPYLDRELREFICAIPQEQIVGVGKRRLMMRRALIGIVPDELLNRKRKPFVPRNATRSVSTEWAELVEGPQSMVSCSIGIIDAIRFRKALQKPLCDNKVPGESLERALLLESWLRHLTIQGVLTNPVSRTRQECSLSPGAENVHAPLHPKSSAS